MHYLTLALKLLVVPVALGFLAAGALRDPRLGALHMDPLLLVAALAANQLALTLFAMRMQLSLRVFGIAIGLRQALRIHLQSVFYYFVLPMTVGMEVARFTKVRRLLGGGAPAARLTYALLADRFLGAVAALLIALAVLPLVRLTAGPRWDEARWLPWAAIACAALAAVFAHPRMRAHAREAIAALRAGQRSLLPSFGFALATHLAYALAVWLAAAGSNVAIGPLQALFAISAGMLFVVIPVSFAGVSPAEAANLGVLLALGIPLEQAALFAFLSYLAKLVAAIEGAAWEVHDGGGQIARLLPSGDK